jgi:hypothetical protein
MASMLHLDHARRLVLLTILIVLTKSARADPSAPATALSPDQRPTLVLVLPHQELMLVHHAQPLSAGKAEALALRLGYFIAAPIIRKRVHESHEPLPQAWRTAQPDRGFAAALTAALDHTQANWPWRALHVVSSEADADRMVAGLRDEDVAVTTFTSELVELSRSLQLGEYATITLLRAAGTPRVTRTTIILKHLAVPLTATPEHADKTAADFRSGAALDQRVSSAALDLSRMLAVALARSVTPTATAVSRHYADLRGKPDCVPCRGTDPVVHEEASRAWVMPAKLPDTWLSLPL